MWPGGGVPVTNGAVAGTGAFHLKFPRLMWYQDLRLGHRKGRVMW